MSQKHPMPGNPHVSGPDYDANHETVDGYAQTQATLALAYEQRTATLVALLAQDNLAGVDYGTLLRTINDRLGMTG